MKPRLHLINHEAFWKSQCKKTHLCIFPIAPSIHNYHITLLKTIHSQFVTNQYFKTGCHGKGLAFCLFWEDGSTSRVAHSPAVRYYYSHTLAPCASSAARIPQAFQTMSPSGFIPAPTEKRKLRLRQNNELSWCETLGVLGFQKQIFQINSIVFHTQPAENKVNLEPASSLYCLWCWFHEALSPTLSSQLLCFCSGDCKSVPYNITYLRRAVGQGSGWPHKTQCHQTQTQWSLHL